MDPKIKPGAPPAWQSPGSSLSSDTDDSPEIDELDLRSRKLTSLLRKNAAKAERRKSVLDVVKDKAWLLEDQVRLLNKQSRDVRDRLAKRSCRRRILVFTALLASGVLLVNKFGHQLREQLNL